MSSAPLLCERPGCTGVRKANAGRFCSSRCWYDHRREQHTADRAAAIKEAIAHKMAAQRTNAPAAPASTGAVTAPPPVESPAAPAIGDRPAEGVETQTPISLPKGTRVVVAEEALRSSLLSFPERGIFCDGDNHFPIADPIVQAAKLAFVRDMKPSAWVNVGDLIDCWFLSRYDKEAHRLFGAYGARLQEEIDSARPYVEAVCSVVDEASLILGNHEHRQGKLINQNPGLHGLRAIGWEGLFEYPAKLRVHPYNTRLKAGPLPLYFVHGDNVPRTVKHPEVWMLTRFPNQTTIFGHTHKASKKFLTTYDERGGAEIHGAINQGHGSIVSEQTYVTEPDWQHAFTWIEPYRDGGKARFTAHLIEVIDGRFSWNGTVYDGRKWQ